MPRTLTGQHASCFVFTPSPLSSDELLGRVLSRQCVRGRISSSFTRESTSESFLPFRPQSSRTVPDLLQDAASALVTSRLGMPVRPVRDVRPVPSTPEHTKGVRVSPTQHRSRRRQEGKTSMNVPIEGNWTVARAWSSVSTAFAGDTQLIIITPPARRTNSARVLSDTAEPQRYRDRIATRYSASSATSERIEPDQRVPVSPVRRILDRTVAVGSAAARPGTRLITRPGSHLPSDRPCAWQVVFEPVSLVIGPDRTVDQLRAATVRAAIDRRTQQTARAAHRSRSATTVDRALSTSDRGRGPTAASRGRLQLDLGPRALLLRSPNTSDVRRTRPALTSGTLARTTDRHAGRVFSHPSGPGPSQEQLSPPATPGTPFPLPASCGGLSCIARIAALRRRLVTAARRGSPAPAGARFGRRDRSYVPRQRRHCAARFGHRSTARPGDPYRVR